MKRALIGLVVAALWACTSSAQTASFTWVGSTDSSQSVQLATIDNQPPNCAVGYCGSIQIVNGTFLWLLDLPQSLGFPNNGFLDCETAITWQAPVWGTRPDGTKMDGTQAGDYNNTTGATVCPLWNGTTDISVTVLRETIVKRQCGRYGCKNVLIPNVMQSGSGTASVEVAALIYRCGSKRIPCKLSAEQCYRNSNCVVDRGGK